jgi:hypothetical protein
MSAALEDGVDFGKDKKLLEAVGALDAADKQRSETALRKTGTFNDVNLHLRIRVDAISPASSDNCMPIIFCLSSWFLKIKTRRLRNSDQKVSPSRKRGTDFCKNVKIISKKHS